jgi:hypothetical protein
MSCGRHFLEKYTFSLFLRHVIGTQFDVLIIEAIAKLKTLAKSPFCAILPPRRLTYSPEYDFGGPGRRPWQNDSKSSIFREI